MISTKRVPTLVALLALLMGLALFAGCGSDDETPAAPPIDTVPPAIPDGVTAWMTDADVISLAWNANVTDADLAGYIVYRSTSVDEGFRALQETPIISNSWVDEHVVPGTVYYYRVSARDASSNESAWSLSYTVRVPRIDDGGDYGASVGQ